MLLTRRLFFIGLGLVTLVAVGAYWWQLPGLAGREGIEPIGPSMDALRGSGAGFWDLPTLLWISSSDAMLHALCAVAFASGLLLVLGFATRAACIALWASWLSLVQLGHPFLAFQWDVLLVESAFCAAFFAPPGWLRSRWDVEPSRAFRMVMLVLACKVTLQSGIVKLTSGDPTWRDLTALTYHWWSQPLPTWTSVIIAQLPVWIQRVMCAAMFVLELVFPVLLFGPRKVRIVGGVGLIALQAGLFVAGNYSFYNVLTAVLAVPALDDAVLKRSAPHPDPLPVSRGEGVRWGVTLGFAIISVLLFLRFDLGFVRRWHTINAYGAFAVMTKSRPEIILEGSTDGATWQAYEFPWKPGDVTRRPTFIAPWQPRLDWQMWFAALGSCSRNPWVLELQRRLLLGSPAVLKLFETNPFPDAPPKMLRTRTFEYRFAPWNAPGTWWTRTETGPYCPAVSLAPDGRLQRAF